MGAAAASSRRPAHTSNSDISILFTNIRSAVRNRDDLSAATDTTSADIVILTETWLNDSVRDSEIFYSQKNYSVFRCDRAGRRGGGVLIAASDNFQCFKLNIDTALEFVSVHITIEFQKFLFCVCYRAPSANSNFCSDLRDALTTVHNMFPNLPILLFGDFNFPDIDWSNPSYIITDRLSESSNFLSVCSEFSLTQLISKPTRVTPSTSSILDLLLTTSPNLISNITYIPGISDHCLVNVTLSLPARASPNSTKTIRNYAKANFVAINNALEEFIDPFLANFNKRSVEENWCIYKSKLHDLFDTYIPRKTIITNRHFPFYNQTLKRLANKKRRLFQKAKSTGKSEAWSRLREHTKIFKQTLKEAKHKFNNITLPSMLSNNPKKFWSIVNKTDRAPISLHDSGLTPVMPSQCANVLNETFRQAFSPVSNICLPDYSCQIRLPMEPITFDFNGIVAIIDRLKVCSSAGPDDINTKILKNTKVYSAIILCKIFEQSLETGILPGDWLMGKVVPLHKSGDKHLAVNYRPISLTSIPCKIMEHIIVSHLTRFLESSSFFSPAQHGFRKFFSCETQLITFTNDVLSILDKGTEVDCIFLDFSKAFDKVAHNLLLIKLKALNIDPNILKWIEYFLTNRSQYVFTNDHCSSSIPVTSGVPQGSVLGPLLFLVYINDLPNTITSRIKLFADDCVIYREVKTTNHTALLQADLDRISCWCRKWQMCLNPTKCKVMRFTRRGASVPPNYNINSTALSLVASYKYLGVFLTSNLTWNKHVTSIISNANRMLGYLKRNFKDAVPSVKLLLYTSLVRSKLEYAAPVWDPHTKLLTDALEAVQNRAVRFICGDYTRFSSVTAMKNTLSLPPLALRRKLSRLFLFFKIYHQNPELKNTLISPPTYISRRIDHSRKVGIPHSRTAAYSHSFLPNTASEWNHLPASLALTDDFEEFKKRLNDMYSTN